MAIASFLPHASILVAATCLRFRFGNVLEGTRNQGLCSSCHECVCDQLRRVPSPSGFSGTVPSFVNGGRVVVEAVSTCLSPLNLSNVDRVIPFRIFVDDRYSCLFHRLLRWQIFTHDSSEASCENLDILRTRATFVVPNCQPRFSNSWSRSSCRRHYHGFLPVYTQRLALPDPSSYH